MKTSEMSERQLLEHIVIKVDALEAGQKSLEAGQQRHDKQFEAVIQTMQKGFAKNDVEHADLRRDIQEVRAIASRSVIEIERLDVERKAIISRQDRFEKIGRGSR